MIAFRSRVGVLSLFLLWVCASSLTAQQFAETSLGFPSNGSIASYGLDSVNLYNGNLVIGIPIGPGYQVGTGLSSQLRLVYNAQLWAPQLACTDSSDIERYGLYVRGSAVFGAGWNLEFGHLDQPSRDVYDPSTFAHRGPDGSEHPFSSTVPFLTDDASFLRRRHPSGAPPEVDFPDGTQAVFGQSVPLTAIEHGATALDFDASGTYATRVKNRYGAYLQITYGGGGRISMIEHFGRNASGNIVRLRAPITFVYGLETVTASGTTNTWTVLREIRFPATGGEQVVRFSYYMTGFVRPSTDLTATFCPAQFQSRSVVAAPLLQKVELGVSTLFYEFDYFKNLDTSLGLKAGVISRMSLPAGGRITYDWARSFTGPLPSSFEASCPQGDNDCRTTFVRRNTIGLIQRTEYPDYPVGSGNMWRYARTLSAILNPRHQKSEVEAPDGYRTYHYFHVEPNETAERQVNGLQYSMEYLDLSRNVVRSTLTCYEGDVGGVKCWPDTNYWQASGNLRKRAEWVYETSGQPRAIDRGGWDGSGHFSVEYHYEWGNAIVRRIVSTAWDANRTDWLLDLYTRRTETEDSLSGQGRVVDRHFEFDRTTGFLRGTFVHDPDVEPSAATVPMVHLSCFYPKVFANQTSDGTLARQFSATYTDWSPYNYPNPPPHSICSQAYGSPPSLSDAADDAFGKIHTYENDTSVFPGRIRTSAQWIKDTAGIGWFSQRSEQDLASGWPVTSYDTAGIATSYAYDAVGRVTTISPQSEAATNVTYETAKQSTVARTGGDGNTIWSRTVTDGFGRLVREIRQMPSAYAVRVRTYDSVGRSNFVSEWATCANEAACGSTAVTAGTTLSNFDPYGRPQLVGRADGTTTGISYADGAVPFSETKKTVTVNNLCIDGGLCPGGTSAATQYRYDARGRLTGVTEPGGAVTSYTYDVNDNLIKVSQPPLSGPTQPDRTFSHDAFGFLRREITPEKGGPTNPITYPLYGSLGNALRKTEGGLTHLYTYDPAGRLTTQTAGGSLFLTNCYDGNTTSACSHAGGSYPAGKLTQRNGENQGSPSRVTEKFTYSNGAGRLSGKDMTITGTPFGTITATQSWAYNSLGLVSSQTNPRIGADAAQTATVSYSRGFPTAVSVGGANRAHTVSYHPAGNLASWTAAVGNNIVTTIGQNATTLTPRPTQISTSAGGFNTGAYVYDGAGNVRNTGSDTYAYDALSRLKNYTVSGQNGTYSYDRWGNLNPGSVDVGTNRLSAASGASYDSRGNLLSYAGKSYGYDYLSRQVSYNGGTERYVYDGGGARVGKITGGDRFWTLTPCRVADTRGNGFSGEWGPPAISTTIRTMTLWGRCGIPAGATGVSGNLTGIGPSGGYLKLFPAGAELLPQTLPLRPGKVRSNNFVLGLSGAGQFGLLAQYPTEAILDVTGYFLNQAMTLTLRDDADRLTTEYTVTPSGATRLRDYFYLGDLLVATRDQSGGTWRYYHSDHLGSPRLVTNASGGVLESHKYLPFGAEIGGSFGIQPMKFAGLERDAASGKDYALARQFGSSEGRFFSPDMLQGAPEKPQSWNRYAYVWNNPASMVDPEGLWPGIGIGRSYLMWQNAFHFDSNTRTLTGSIFVNQTLLRLSYGLNGFIGSMGDAFGPLVRLNDVFESGAAERFKEGRYISGAIDEALAFLLPDDESEAILLVATLGRSGVRVTFGHGARHLANTGLSQKAVETAIRSDVVSQVTKASTSGAFWGKVAVEGKTILYRAYTRAEGFIHVGTYYLPR